MSWHHHSLTRRLMLALAALLLGFATLIVLLGRQAATTQDQEALQRLSQGLAQHIVGHWPVVSGGQAGRAEQAERDAVLQMLQVVNPGIQVYVLDATGQVQAYLGEPGMVRQPQVDLAAVRRFLAAAPLPILGTDPMGGARQRVFSAARFAATPADATPPGYLYIVLDGGARSLVAGQVSLHRLWQGAALVAALGLLATLALGALLLRHLTRPLQQLAARMQAYRGPPSAPPATAADPAAAAPATPVAPTTLPAAAQAGGDEVQAITQAYLAMTDRIELQALREAAHTSAHREMMASVAHDLRTPLTALHGHLEALAASTPGHPSTGNGRLLAAALAQSDKVRRLSQQLFELATLQSTDQLLHRERFSLDELVADAVEKFGLHGTPAPVVLGGNPPGRIELDGDLQLIERALSNLIDNALRHAPGGAPVRVSLQREGPQARVLVEDTGPGLPAELAQRLQQGLSLRNPPMPRPGGGIGGLGLAIAQRVAQLHGGSLQPLAAAGSGTRLCLALPVASVAVA